tara:strand:- start:383 stop:598 length:216 start_codon:yes stop_codon:yes gene_type:complete
MRYFPIVVAVLFLTSCATAEVPDRVANTYTVAGKIYCRTPIGHNIETIVVGWLNATIAPSWQPVCGDRDEN